ASRASRYFDSFPTRRSSDLDVRVPEAPAEMGRVPRQHPGDEQRIAEISGKVAGEAASERPRQCDGEDGVQQSHQEHIALFVHERDRKSTRLNSSHLGISYAV